MIGCVKYAFAGRPVKDLTIVRLIETERPLKGVGGVPVAFDAETPAHLAPPQVGAVIDGVGSHRRCPHGFADQAGEPVGKGPFDPRVDELEVGRLVRARTELADRRPNLPVHLAAVDLYYCIGRERPAQLPGTRQRGEQIGDGKATTVRRVRRVIDAVVAKVGENVQMLDPVAPPPHRRDVSENDPEVGPDQAAVA